MVETQLDENHYDTSTLLDIKVPIRHLAYFNPSAKFSRVDGVIKIDGRCYRYVKRRLLPDSLELLCIPDIAGTKMQQARNDFATRSYNFPHTPNTKTLSNLDIQKIYVPVVANFAFPNSASVNISLGEHPNPFPMPGFDQPTERPPAA